MEQLPLVFKKFFSFSLSFVIATTLIFGVAADAFAQQQQQQSGLTVTGNGNVTGPSGTQANTATNGIQGTNSSQETGENIVSGIAGCAASIVANAIGGLINTIAAKYAGVDNYTRVSITSANDVAHSGDSNGYYPSLDAIGYCIINGVLAYLTQATVDWINSGFDGNPAFVEDPEKFFGDIADIEAASFLQQVVGKTTGLNICEPFRLNIVTGLAGTRNNPYGKQSACTFDQMQAALGSSGVNFDYNEYTSGASYSGDLDVWRHVTQNDQNNFLGSYLMAQQELNKRLAIKGNTANLDLTLGRGFLSFKKCGPDTTHLDSDGNTVAAKGECKTTTPGTVIEEQLNNRLSTGNDRLKVADKFDQIVTALINQLIKVALNEVLNKSE